MEDSLFKQQEYAEMTIKVGDFIVTVKGRLEPPTLTTERFNKNLYSLGYKDALGSDIEEIDFKIKPTGKMVTQRWRWTIPVAIKPKIEE